MQLNIAHNNIDSITNFDFNLTICFRLYWVSN